MGEGLTTGEIGALAELFTDPLSAGQLLNGAGLRRAHHPAWVAGLSAHLFWSEVSRLLAAGVLADGRDRLLAAAHAWFPANPAFVGGPLPGGAAGDVVAAVVAARLACLEVMWLVADATARSFGSAVARKGARRFAQRAAREHGTDADALPAGNARGLARAGGDRLADWLDQGRGRSLDRAHQLTDQLAAALDRARELGGDDSPGLDRACYLAHDLVNRLRIPALRDLRTMLDTLNDLGEHLMGTVTVEASGLDLSALKGVGLDGLDLLAGVTWTEETTWPPHLTEPLRARSIETSPGIYQIRGDEAWALAFADVDRQLDDVTATPAPTQRRETSGPEDMTSDEPAWAYSQEPEPLPHTDQ